MELISLSGFHNGFTPSPLSKYGNSKMVDCPECGKPLKKSKGSKYCCENSRCSVIFVRHPDKPPLTTITHKAKARVGFYE
jgi:hypothetical protein